MGRGGVEIPGFMCSEAPAGDIDGDGVIDVSDLLTLLARWGPCAAPCPPSCSADLDGDCNAGVSDLLLMIANWTT